MFNTLAADPPHRGGAAYLAAALAALEKAVTPTLSVLVQVRKFIASLTMGPDGVGEVEAAGRSWRIQLTVSRPATENVIITDDHTQAWADAIWE